MLSLSSSEIDTHRAELRLHAIGPECKGIKNYKIHNSDWVSSVLALLFSM